MSNKKKPAKKSAPVEPAMESLEIGGDLYITRLTSKFRNRQIWQKPDEKRIEAVIPGTIQKIMAKEGDEVVAGTPLLKLPEICAPSISTSLTFPALTCSMKAV